MKALLAAIAVLAMTALSAAAAESSVAFLTGSDELTKAILAQQSKPDSVQSYTWARGAHKTVAIRLVDPSVASASLNGAQAGAPAGTALAGLIPAGELAGMRDAVASPAP